jgi:superfamily II DNA helicase RecQ
MTGKVQDVLIAAPRSRPAPAPGGKRRRIRDGRGERIAERSATPRTPIVRRPPLAPIVDALREWRLDEARRSSIAPFVVLHDKTLLAIASTLPRSSEDLLAIPGIGPAKLATYGDAILAIVKVESEK